MAPVKYQSIPRAGVKILEIAGAAANLERLSLPAARADLLTVGTIDACSAGLSSQTIR
jgi:hypothetical protein